MRDIDELVKTIEKLIKDHGVSVSESDKERLEQMLEDFWQTGYDEGYNVGYDDGYSMGYDSGYDFGTMSAD